ncbi:MAG: helix-turn-helix transcriptional regulator [Flavisolibacter sp.]
MRPIKSTTHGPLVFIPSLPKAYNGPVLKGSEPFFCDREFGWMVIQEFSKEKFSICYSVLKLLQKMIFQFREGNWLRVLFAMEGEIHCKMRSSHFQLLPLQYQFIWAPGQEQCFTFKKGRQYQIFSLRLEADWVQKLLPEFPHGNFPQRKRKGWALPQQQQSIRDILSASYPSYGQSFFIETKIRELIFSLLIPSSEPVSGAYRVSEREFGQVMLADQLILHNLKVHYTIPELAEKVKMGEMRLKSAFKQVIGSGPFERLREARLHKAASLLIETDMQVKVIFREVGYESITGFIDAFRDRFGMAPTQYRKKYKPVD